MGDYSCSHAATWDTGYGEKTYDVSAYNYVIVGRIYINSASRSEAHTEGYIYLDGVQKFTFQAYNSSKYDYCLLHDVREVSALKVRASMYYTGNMQVSRVYGIK